MLDRLIETLSPLANEYLAPFLLARESATSLLCVNKKVNKWAKHALDTDKFVNQQPHGFVTYFNSVQCVCMDSEPCIVHENIKSGKFVRAGWCYQGQAIGNWMLWEMPNKQTTITYLTKGLFYDYFDHVVIFKDWIKVFKIF